jgi:sirohydrochlorin ferrochelatase
MTTAVVLLGHGSPVKDQTGTIAAIARQAQDLDQSRAWRDAYLDHHGPSLVEAVAAAVESGADDVVIVPALLSNAFHARDDVPAQVRKASSMLKVPITIAEPLGLDDRWSTVLHRHVAALDAAPDVVAVASAGTGDRQARERFRATVRQWRGRIPYRLNACFIASGDPDVTELIAPLVDQGWRVVLAPFLLADGQLLRRAAAQALDAGAVAVAEPLGAPPEAAEIAKDRADACGKV